ncbi:MAG TPA: AzlC family ABC transporter permease [Actinophytocola sp.]|uniref:AzlC family ABC transporter permease n=1 Tax=Actinophytocola sp. TaxID=1872138 RepID=UPI002DBCE087|nr:AzlC family ABC transporter permease [Actinophytocola sp.]HEU5472868.1 AzlC family ABC transporter permease [Actinophytocola sp.]
MRSLWRTLDRSLVRDVLAVAAAVAAVGMSFGAIAVSAGLPAWQPVLLSVLVFAGGSQFLAVGVIAAGGAPLAAVLGGLVLNARHLPFGLAIGGTIGRGRLLGSHLMTDESVAFALAQRDPARARTAYWTCGVALFTAWNLGTVAGVLVGSAIGDPAAFGLDAAFPAALLALVLPGLRDPATRRPALLGGAIALAASPFLPPGVPVLLALAGLVAVPRRRAVLA